MKKGSYSYTIAVVFVVVAVASALLDRSEGACNSKELDPCKVSLQNGTPPSADCCTKLKQQQPCLCQYIREKVIPVTPNAIKIAVACKVSVPAC